MRIAIVGLITALSLVSASAVDKKVDQVCVGTMTTEYPCEWQRKLLVAQRDFASDLDQVDETTTGSITRLDR